ncbi:MAG TPA: hypothetical protein VIA18_24305, partial [Polyangia bacterium]|nr:hypothetical protein [Polyangia bacterium]
ATATASVGDVTTACQNIALDLGADPTDASVQGKTGTDALAAWCALAVSSINADFGASGSLATSVTVDFEPPVCTASLTATANCQASCSADAKCDIKANPPMCMGGSLTVECSGSCTASGTADVACTGSCSGKCSGSCKATGGVAVDCQGKCDGTCTAGGASNGMGVKADGSCDGTCDGTCTLDATAPMVACKGTCDGHCDAACKGTADVKVKCDGSCDADYTPVSCNGGTLTGGCKVDASCQGSCNASASAKASCTPPTLAVVATAKASLDATGSSNLQAAIASLEKNLPSILVVFKARGAAFTGSLTAAGSAAVDITTTHSGDIGAKGAVCGVIIASAITTAADNFGKALSAAGSVAGSLSIK